MNVKRIVANIATEDVAAAKRFYGEALGLDMLMDMGWIATYGSGESMGVQLSVMSEGGSGTAVPDISVEVDDLKEEQARLSRAGFEPEYGPVDEPWGVRRFYVRDPFGRLVNVLVHSPSKREIDEPDDPFWVSICLYGDALIPEEVSASLSVLPSRSFRKGERVVSATSGKERVQKTGVWIVDATSKSPELTDHLSELASLFPKPWKRVTDIPGVDIARLDVLFQPGLTVRNTAEVFMEIDALDAEFLSSLGLSFLATISTHED